MMCKPTPAWGSTWPFDTNAVILYYQCSFPVARKKANQDIAGVPVLDGIIHGFLGNVIKMGGGRGVMDQDRRLALEAATNPEQIFEFRGVELQGRHEPMRIRHHR